MLSSSTVRYGIVVSSTFKLLLNLITLVLHFQYYESPTMEQARFSKSLDGEAEKVGIMYESCIYTVTCPCVSFVLCSIRPQLYHPSYLNSCWYPITVVCYSI